MSDPTETQRHTRPEPALGGQASLVQGLEEWRPAAVEPGEPLLTVTGILGRGSQGAVLMAMDADCRRMVAVKALHAHRREAADRAQFLREIQITAQLEHPGVVPVHEVGVLPDGTAFYTMKRIEGSTLADLVEGEGVPSPARRVELLQIMLKVCDTLAFAHHRGVIHRDLKPRNIMVGRFGEVLVLDWGLAKVVGRSGEGDSVRLSPSSDSGESAAGFAVGTAAYMSPEQAAGKPIDARSDIYGVGVILYRLLTAASPYRGGPTRELLGQVAAGDWRLLDQDPAGRRLPRRLRAIVHRSMALDPQDRYATAEDLAEDLRRFLDGLAVEACRETPLEVVVRAAVRQRRPLLAATGALALAGFAWGCWTVQAHRETSALRQRLAIQAQEAEADGRLDEARRDLERLQDLSPEDRTVRWSLERVRAAAQAAAAAREAATRAREADLLMDQARERAASDQRDDLRQAMEAYQQALGLVPGDARALEGHRAAAGRLAVLDQREEEARLLAARQAQVVELRRQADAATDAGDPVGAAAHLKAALALVNSAEDSQRLVQVLAAVERQEQERRRAARRFEADALEVEVRQALAEGRGQDAQEAVERIRGLDPEHPDLQDLTAAAATAVRRQRVAEARAVLSEAATPMAQASDLRRRLQNLEQERQQAALELAETPGPGLRARLQAAEQAIADARARRSMELARAVALLQQAWTKAPWDEAPSAALADFWIARLEEADSTDDEAAAAAAEAQARLYDTAGRHRTLIEGRAAVEVPAEASAVRLRALVPGPDRTLRPTGPEVVVPPGTRRDLVRGHWLAEGPPGTAQALHLERGAVVTVTLPTVSAVAGTAYIPTGRIYGRGGVPGPVVPAFRLARLEVTVGEWIEFLNAPSTQRRYEEALAEGHLILAPRAGYAADVPLWRRDGLLSQGRFLAERQDGTPIPLDLPVTGICPQDAREYAAWRATRDRLSWRLPTVAEWTLAVQGGDGRRFPWGEADDASLCSSGIQSREPHPVGSSPTDVSVQGVLDLAGSVSEFAQPEAGSSTFPLLGGNRLDRDPARLGWSQHREVDARYVHPAAGLRLALDARP